MLEANRMAGLASYNQVDDATDQFKNSWLNNVSQSGVEVQKGDVISVDTVAIQNQGSVGDTIEILGIENDSGYLDNKLNLTYGCYINHSGTNTVPLPFLSQETYLSSNDAGNTKLPAVIRDYTNKNFTRNRGLGDVNLSDYIVYPGAYENHNNVPTNYSFINIKVLNGGTGIDKNSVYKDSTGKYVIKAISVESGVMIYYTMVNVPDGASLGTVNQVQQITFTTNVTDVSKPPTSNPIVEFYICDFKRGSTKNNLVPDGSRYYPPGKGFTGVALISDGLPNDITAQQFNPSALSPGFQIRQKTVNLEIPTGLNSPSNIAAILTDQLQRPTNVANTITDFANLESFERYSIETPSTFITPCNFNPLCSPYLSTSFSGARAFWYSNIAYKNPEKIEGLQFFRQLAYGADNTVTTNEIDSGSTPTQVVDIGDCFSQTIGNFGLTPIIARPMPVNSTNGTSNIPRTALVLTNIKLNNYTTVIDKIASGFKTAEKYYGDRTIKLSPTSITYLAGLALPLDIGLYCDEKGSVTDPSVTNPRWRFMDIVTADGKAAGADILEAVSDPANFGKLIGSQPPWFEESNTNNDGSQLSSIVVSSRFRTDYDEAELLTQMATVSPSGTFPYNTATYTSSQLFNGVNADEILAYAKLKDVCVVPVYPEHIGQNPGINTEPYLAFVSHLTLDDTSQSYDRKTATGWKIDARNCFMGMQLGLDISFTRNEACAMVNTNFKDTIIDATTTAADTFVSFTILLTLPAGECFVTANFINEEGYFDDWETPFPISLPAAYDGESPLTIKVGRQLKPGSDISFDVVEVDGGPVKDFTTTTNVIAGGGSASAVISEFSPYINLGGYGNQIIYNPVLSRFEISDMNTPCTLSNGQPYVLPGLRESLGLSSTSPDQQVLNYAVKEICYSYVSFGTQIILPAFIGSTSNSSIVDSQTGLCLLAIGLCSIDGIFTYQTYNTDKTLNISDSLLDKLGYDLEQVLPSIGGVQTKFNDFPTFKNETNTYQSFLNKFTRPLTTSAVFGSSTNQALQTSAGGSPLFLLGTSDGEESRPTTTQGSLTAFKLPSQLSYPYLLVYSSLIQGGTSTIYRGGNDSQALIPCMATVDRYNNSGSFFYGSPSSFDFTATRNFVVSEIQTDIRLPNGGKPRLLSQSSVIYKITKPLRQLVEVPDTK